MTHRCERPQREPVSEPEADNRADGRRGSDDSYADPLAQS